MIVDFHTHAFPDTLAPRAIAGLYESAAYAYTPVHDGTVTGTLRNMDAWGISMSVLQPVITKASQLVRINEWAASVRSDRIEAFGGIYPHTDDYKSAIDFAASLGLKGLKFHAEYQNFLLDDPHMLRIYDCALSRGFKILHHAGYDPAFPPPFHTNPERFAHLMREFPGAPIIAAHLGGHAQWDDVERYLAGSGIYLDTSMGFSYFPHDQFLRIVKAVGAEHVLFGSDAPWSCAHDEIQALRALPLTDTEKNAILSDNARRLLGR